MKIQVQFYSYLRDAVGYAEETLDLDEGANVGRALEILCHRHSALVAARNHILLAVGLDWVKPDAPLQEGDVLSLMPPVQGG
jgi:molybdopterin converting factor small subunit